MLKKLRAVFMLTVLVLGITFLASSQRVCAASADGGQIVSKAREYIGKVPYVWGGNNIDGANVGADCSGFVCRIYEYFGYNLWPNRVALRNCGTNLGTNLNDAQLGDIIWFSGHVGIYSGLNSKGQHMLVHETGGKYQNVVETPISWVNAELKGIIRIPGVSIGGNITPIEVTATWTDYPSQYWIGTDDASVSKTLALSGAPISRVTQVGIEVYKWDGSMMIANKSETPIPKNGVINMWYTMYKELGLKLYGGGKYQYIFFARLDDGTEFRSEVHTIQTNGGHECYYEFKGREAAHPHKAICACAYCGNQYTQESANAFTEVKMEGVAATCETKGLTEGSKCSVCGEILVAQKEIKALGHKYTSKIVKAASCTATGTKRYTCSVCGKSYDESIAKTSHSVVVDKEVKPTATTTGLTEGSHCSVCNTVIVAQKVIPATGSSNENGLFATNNGCKFYKDSANNVRCYRTDGTQVINEFKCDGTYTYYFQADGTAMRDRLTYHPDGVHVIYFDGQGHEVFSNFANVKKAIAGNAVDDYCFFDVNGYLYVNVVTYDQSGTKLYYANEYGVMDRNKWFRFSDTAKWADGKPFDRAGGEYGYATSDGSLLINTWTQDANGRACYMQGNGVAKY